MNYNMFNNTDLDYNNLNFTNGTENSLCESNESNQITSTYEYELIVNGIQGYILWGIVFIVITFLGCIGNIITIVVLKKDPIMTSLNVLLIALAISDILAPIANALLAISFYHLSNTYSNSVNFLIFNDILRHIIQPLSTMFTMSSSWIVTTTTLFRLIAVMWPFKARTLINRRFAVLCLLIIFGFGLASVIPLYGSIIRKVKCTRDNKYQYLAFEIEISSEIMAKGYVPMIQTMCFYLPWLLALLLWLFLLRSLKRSERNFNVTFVSKENSTVISNCAYLNVNHPNNNNLFGSNKNLNASFLYGHNRNSQVIHTSNNNNNNNNNNDLNGLIQDARINNAQTRQKSYNRITLMVVVLTFTNLICRLFTFVFIFEVIYNEYLKRKYFDWYMNGEPDDLDEDLKKIINSPGSLNDEDAKLNIFNSRNHYPKFLAYSLLLNNIFLCINHSCNIIIYTITNPKFKKNLISLFESFFKKKYFSKKLNRSDKSYGKSVINREIRNKNNRRTNKNHFNQSLSNDEYFKINSREISINRHKKIFNFSKIFRCFCTYEQESDSNDPIRLENVNNHDKIITKSCKVRV